MTAMMWLALLQLWIIAVALILAGCGAVTSQPVPYVCYSATEDHTGRGVLVCLPKPEINLKEPASAPAPQLKPNA